MHHWDAKETQPCIGDVQETEALSCAETPNILTLEYVV